jgi:hypothetical protein
MAQVQLYAQQQNNGQYVALDLHIEEPIKLNLSVANIIDPTATNSTFSRTFRVPHTAVNGPYFEGVFSVNSLNFDASKKADAYILDNGIFFENGNIRLNAINVNSKDNSVEYEITFYGSTSDFGSKIGGGFMNEIDLTQYNHTKSWANISGSWSTIGGLFDGAVRYGLIEWGYTYNAQNQPTIPTLSTGFAKSFTNSVNPYLKDQWKPQIRAKAIWDQIFEEVGYTYDSVFLDSEFFKNQYIISDNVASATLNNSNTFLAERQGIYNTTIGQPFPWITPIEISDPGNNFSPSSIDSGVYTAPSTGNYDMQMKADEVEFYLFGMDETVTIGWEANIIDADTGISFSQENGQWVFSNSNPGGQTLNATFGLYLTAGVRVKFQFRTYVISGQTSIYGTNLQFYGQSVACTLAPEVLSVNGIMPSNIRKIDFMKSIINRYRLVFAPSKFVSNHFTITPWKDWILEGRSKDWTTRLDTSKDMVIKPLFFDQARFQIYKDQEDSDYLNYNYQLGIKQTFGQLNLDSTNELIKGTKEYKDQFAPTPLDGIGYIAGSSSEIQAASFLIPHMAKDTGGNGESVGSVSVGKREPIQPKLRLVFWNGMRTAPITWYAQSDSAQVTMSDYPLMSQYSNFPVTSTTFDLNWENELPLYNYDLIAGVLTNPKAQTSFSCFNTFWKTWYDVTFDPYSRIVEAYFALDYNEILDLKFNDYIFVKDAWYFVNSVSDYVAGQTSNCKVQLIKLGNNIGITLPVVTPPTYTAFNTCYSQDDLCTSHCCAVYAGAQNVTIYANGTTLIDSTLAYQDATGGIIAAPGYYTDPSGTIFVNSNGVIIVQNASACNCVPVSYAFTVHVNTTGCEVCCNNGPLITVYGLNAIFLQNTSFWTNALLTTPGPAGFYKQSGEGTALQVASNGTVINNFFCSNCECVTYYPFTVCTATNLCDACCCFSGTSTVYGTNPTFASNTTLYTTNNGSQRVTNGFYKFNDTTVAQVTGGEGAVTAFGTCTSCTPCPVGPVEITVNVSAQVTGYITTTLLQKSYDNGVSYIDVGTVTIGSDQPANTQISQMFSVENGVRLKAISSTTTVNGSMQTNYLINLDTFSNTTVATPSTVTLTLSSLTSDEFTYEFNNIVSGGDVVVSSNIITVGNFDQYKANGFPAAPFGLYGGIADVNTLGTINSQFNVGAGGFTDTSIGNNIAFVKGVSVTADNVYVAGQFNRYKGANIGTASARGIAKLDYNGNIDATFKTNIGNAVITVGALMNDILVYENKVYLVGNFSQFNGQTGTQSIVKLNLDGTRDTSFTSPFPANTIINKVYGFNSKIFVTIDGYLSPIRLNANGSRDTSWSMTPPFGSPNYPVGTFKLQSLVFYNDIIYAGCQIQGTDTGNIAKCFILKWNANTGSSVNWSVNTPDVIIDNISNNTRINNIVADSTGLYVGGIFDTVETSLTRNNLFKVNFNGTINTGFISNIDRQGGAASKVNTLLLDSTGLYVGGTFNRVNGNTAFPSRNLVKVNNTTGTVITSFATAQSFTPEITFSTAASVLDLVFKPAQIALYAINISYSDQNACAAYCATPYNTVIYGNAINLTNSTSLYANVTGTTPAAAGWYSDGASIAQVDGNGLIIGYTNVNSCNCNTLYEFNTTYDADLCTSCNGSGLMPNVIVYGLNSNWSSNTVLYTNAQGTNFALDGYYTYNNGIALQVFNNGNVVNSFDCTTSCGLGDCYAVYNIQNTSGNILQYNFTSCLDEIIYGEIYPGQTVSTGVCIRQGSLNVIGGTYNATVTAIC